MSMMYFNATSIVVLELIVDKKRISSIQNTKNIHNFYLIYLHCLDMSMEYTFSLPCLWENLNVSEETCKINGWLIGYLSYLILP